MRTRQPGFFVCGGTFTMSRFYSKVTALLIKAYLEAINTQKRAPTIEVAQVADLASTAAAAPTSAGQATQT